MRKSYLSAVFAVLWSGVLFGNVGVFRGGGQTPVLEKSSEIQMVEELVEMRPRRGNYPVDTSCRNLDKMDFRCRFLLRNLSDKKVVVQVGFPLDTQSNFEDRDGKTIDQKRIIREYDFSVRAKDRDFPVRFVPWDKNREFSKIFLWEMTFEPKEEQELFVTYTMEGYFGMASTGRAHWAEKALAYRCRYLEYLCMGVGQIQFYVTETGSSWAGRIEKATFRIVPFDFEKYLAQRGAFEGERAESKRGKNVQVDIFATAPLVRSWSPSYDKWKLVKDKLGRELYLELVYTLDMMRNNGEPTTWRFDK